MAEPIKISRSDLATFKRCRKKWQFNQADKLTQTPNGPMTFGTLGHYGLAAGYESMARVQRMGGITASGLLTPDNLVHTFVEIANDAIDSMVRQGYSVYRDEKQPLALPGTQDDRDQFVREVKDSVLYYATVNVPSDFTRYKVLFTEKEFSYTFKIEDVPTGGGSLGGTPYLDDVEVEFSGVMDLGVEDLTYGGKRVLTIADHKFKGNVRDAQSFLPIDTQMLFYEVIAWRVALEMGYDDVELLYNVIRREVPPGFGSRSLKTKSGAPSKASTDPKDYLLRETLFHSTKQREHIESYFHSAVGEMLRTQANDGPYLRTEIQTGGEACGQCPYLARCGADLVGAGMPRIGAMG